MASDGINGAELWRSDGTAAGTIMLKDINTGSGDSYPREFTSLGGAVYFMNLSTPVSNLLPILLSLIIPT